MERPPWESDERSWEADNNWQAEKDEELQQDDQWKALYYTKAFALDEEELPSTAWVLREHVAAAVAIQVTAQVTAHVESYHKRWCERETQWFEELRYERGVMEEEKDMLKMFLDKHQEIEEQVKKLRKTRIEKATRGPKAKQ